MRPTAKEQIRERGRAATRQALLDAGLAEMIAQGGHTPSIERICARAGYTRGAFYSYFEDRRHFVREMLRSLLARFERATKSNADSDASVRDVVASFVQFVAGGNAPRGLRTAYLAIMNAIGSEAGIGEDHAEIMDASKVHLAERLRQGQEAGEVRDDIDPGDAARLLQLIAVGAIFWHGIDIEIDENGAARTLIQMLSSP